MQVQTPFYVIKRTAVTKEAASAFGYNLAQRPYTTSQQDREDLIDFCLADTKEEKVFLSFGDRVRLKDNEGWRHYAPTSGEAVLSAMSLAGGCLWVQFDIEDDFNAIRTDNNMDISDYVELL